MKQNKIAVKKTLLLVVSCLMLSPLAALSCAGTGPTLIPDPISTNAGLVSGEELGDSGEQVRIYRGIPYAAPPVGDLRWKPPQPVEPWDGVRE